MYCRYQELALHNFLSVSFFCVSKCVDFVLIVGHYVFRIHLINKTDLLFFSSEHVLYDWLIDWLIDLTSSEQYFSYIDNMRKMSNKICVRALETEREVTFLLIAWALNKIVNCVFTSHTAVALQSIDYLAK